MCLMKVNDDGHADFYGDFDDGFDIKSYPPVLQNIEAEIDDDSNSH